LDQVTLVVTGIDILGTTIKLAYGSDPTAPTAMNLGDATYTANY